MSDLTPNENLKNLLNREDFLKTMITDPEKVMKYIGEHLFLTKTTYNSGMNVKCFEEFVKEKK